MAKVYAGFYDYGDTTAKRARQQRVPMIVVAKVGNPHVVHDAKPGNRGKRDSQIVLMIFLQKVMFDERMTTFELFNLMKNMFYPQAVCKTTVPDSFRVLLSQRRRWINTIVHNLFEPILVHDLCGTFCFSIQFVVGMELMGTLVLPVAISFTLSLVIISIIGTGMTIPLILLSFVLGLPGLLIVVTSRKVAYLGWMVAYLSLPIWNGLLPAYAFWHFDDFSWGQTRRIAGDKGGDHGDRVNSIPPISS